MRQLILARLATAGFAAGLVGLSLLAGCSSDDPAESGAGGTGATTGGAATTGGTGGTGATTGGTGATTGGTSATAGGTSATTGGSAGAATGGTGGGTPNCSAQEACLATSFAAETIPCGTCHAASGLQNEMLDLASPGLAARLVNVPARHMEPTSKVGCPTGDKLVDTANPDNSWLLKKIKGTQGDCGTPMPYAPGATAATVTCVSTWINCLAGK